MKLSKLGFLTTSTLLSLALLTSCSSKSDDTPTPSTPDVVAPSISTTPNIPPSTSTDDLVGDDGAADLGLDLPEEEGEGENEDEEINPEDMEDMDGPATPPEGEEAYSAPALSSTSISLNEVGASTPLTVSGGKDLKSITYKSDNENVASVTTSGIVTAVSSGSATITVTFSNDGTTESLTASVLCTIEEAKPEETTPEAEPEATPEAEPESTPEVEPEPTPEPEVTPDAGSSVDLNSFYKSMSSAHGFGSMESVSGDFLANFFPGMANVKTSQQEIYMAMMTASAVEIALVEVENSSDVNTVKNIFETRIKTQVEGGAWYPETIEAWEKNSRVVTNGNFVLMIVHPNCDAVVSSFQGLF